MQYDVVFIAYFSTIWSMAEFSHSVQSVVLAVSGCRVQQATVPSYFSKAAEPERQQNCKGRRKSLTWAEQLMCALLKELILLQSVPGSDFLCNDAHLAKPDFSQRVISCIF